MKNEIERIAASLPRAERVAVPFETYVAYVAESLKWGDCWLCYVCGEPHWLLEPESHICFSVASHYERDLEGCWPGYPLGRKP